MKIKVLILLPFICLLQSCSWQEYFVITNQTNASIIVEYSIETPETGFSIFDANPLSYKLSSDDIVYLNKTANITDLDTAKLSVKIILPPNEGLIIGDLQNDKYESYNQYFINGRHFNLKNIKILSAETVTEITPPNFDKYFTKHKKVIAHKVK